MDKLGGLVNDNFNPTLLKTVFQSCQAIQRTTAAHLPPLTWRDVGVAWIPLAKQHEQEVVHCANCPTCTDHAEVMTWLDMCNWAMAAYDASTRLQVASILGIKHDDVLNVHCSQSAPSSAPQSMPPGEQDFLPAYFVAVDHDVKVVRVVVRGTSVFKDLLIDFNGVTASFMSGYAHCGIALASKALVEEELPRLEEALKKHPGCEVQFVGHSLGGGIAALAACYLNWDPKLAQRLPGTRVTAVTFASPPVLTKELASEAKGFVRAIINNNDMVPRASMAGVVELAHEILAAKERLCEDHKVTAFMAGGAVRAAQEGRVLGKALGETLEAASKSLFSSMKRSAVEWREQQQQQQQPPQASRGFTAAGNASNTNSRGSSFFGAIASAAVGFIDATVPADTPSKQATPSQHGSSGGAHVRTQSRSAAQPGTSNSAAGVAAAQSAEQQQEQEQLQQQDRPCPGQQEDLLAGTAVPGHSSVPASASTAAPQAAEAEPTLAAPPDPHTAQAEPTVAAPPDPQTAQAEPTVAAPPNPHATQDAVPFHTSSTTDPSLTDAPPPPTNPDGSLDTVALDPQTQHLLQACADMDAADAKADAAQHPGTDTTAAAVEAAAAAAPPSAATPGCHEAGQQQQQQQRQQQQQEQLHHLYNPGVLHYIKRDGRLFYLYKDVPASQFKRVLIKQSSLDDHGISAYRKALTDLIFHLSSMPLK